MHNGRWAECDMCLDRMRAHKCRKNWKGQLVCPDCYQDKHPQLNVRVVPEMNVIRDARPERIVYNTTGNEADSDGICESQQPTGAGALSINGALASGGTATMDIARQITISSDADDTEITFTITGTDNDGNAQSEQKNGVNHNTIFSENKYLTVTEATVSAATKGNITVGTATVYATVTANDL